MNSGNGYQNAVLQDALYVPDLNGNLLSISHFARRGSEIRFVGEGCQLLDQRKNTACVGHLRGNLYIMDINVAANESAKLATVPSFPSEGDEAPALALTARTKPSSADLQTWHRRLGHLNPEAVTRMLNKGMVTGMEITDGSPIATPCEPCVKGKQTRAEIYKSTETRADNVLGRIFTDVCGRLPTKSHDGFEYFITWVDDKSRKVFVAGMREKSEVTCHLKAFISWAEVETGQRVGILRSDGGGEYIAGEAQRYLGEKGIKHEITTPNTPQHNGVAERMNRTLLDKVRAMLIDANLPQSYWYDALRYAAHIHNVTPTQALDNITPEEAWSGNKPNVSNLRMFGVRAFVHIPDSHRDKLSARSLVCTFIGLARQRKAYRLVHRQTR
jgi:transposase InsO family protein